MIYSEFANKSIYFFFSAILPFVRCADMKKNDMLAEAERIINNYSIKYYRRQCRKRRAKLAYPLCLLFIGLAVLIFITKG